MAKQSANRRAYSSATGRMAEVRFQRAARAKGLHVTKSSHSLRVSRGGHRVVSGE